MKPKLDEALGIVVNEFKDEPGTFCARATALSEEYSSGLGSSEAEARRDLLIYLTGQDDYVATIRTLCRTNADLEAELEQTKARRADAVALLEKQRVENQNLKRMSIRGPIMIDLLSEPRDVKTEIRGAKGEKLYVTFTVSSQEHRNGKGYAVAYGIFCGIEAQAQVGLKEVRDPEKMEAIEQTACKCAGHLMSANLKAIAR